MSKLIVYLGSQVGSRPWEFSPVSPYNEQLFDDLILSELLDFGSYLFSRDCWCGISEAIIRKILKKRFVSIVHDTNHNNIRERLNASDTVRHVCNLCLVICGVFLVDEHIINGDCYYASLEVMVTAKRRRVRLKTRIYRTTPE